MNHEEYDGRGAAEEKRLYDKGGIESCFSPKKEERVCNECCTDGPEYPLA